MSSPQYFDFIRNVWRQLPTEDRNRMAELWKGYEQAIAAAYQKFVEASLDVSVGNLLPYNEERWLPYTFNADNFLNKPAVFRSVQDLSVGVNLANKYLVKFSWDGNPALEVDLRGFNPSSTSIADVVAKINTTAGFVFAKSVVNDALLELTSPTSGPASSIEFFLPSNPSADAGEFILGLLQSDLPKKVPDYPYCYRSQYPSLVSIPAFRDAIRDESVGDKLVSGTDFTVEASEVCFKIRPPELLWAKRSFFNEETPWNNFGFLMDIYQKNSARYVGVIQGLWFAFWTGPRPENLRKALYLLFGLPTSPYDGTVTEVTSSSISVTSDENVTTTVDIPLNLAADVVVGQRIEMFKPLVTGISVFDKVNKPGFIRDEIGRTGIQRFLLDDATRGTGDTDETKALQLLEEFCFLPQISVDAFITPDINIRNVRIFLDAIKPITKTYLFQVIVGKFQDPVTLGESLGLAWDANITPSVDLNETTYQLSLDLLAHETTVNPGLCLDTEVVLFKDAVEFEVRSFSMLIDFFSI